MRISTGYQLLIAVLGGIFVGLFFGPLANSLKPIGDIYVMLLQMAVLPYICFSLIHGLGSMSPELGKRLFRQSWPYLLLLWVLIFGVILMIMQLIPNASAPLIVAKNAQVFDSNFSRNFLEYLIPKNPVYDIANNMAPAIAVFGLIGGVALMHIKEKEPLLSTLERVNQTIEKILYWLGVLAPVGAFVYISIAFGTVDWDDVYKIGLYAIAFVATALFVTLVILPVLLTSLTKMSYGETLETLRAVCLVPFVTGVPTAALPFLNMYLKRLSEQHETHEKFRQTSQTVLPLAYSFGNIGNAMTLFIILFLGFYFRHPFTGLEKGLLSVLTVPLSIGTSTGNTTSLLFMIQQLGFPDSAVEFSFVIKSITFNFQVLMSIAGVITLIILSLYAYYGILEVKWRQLIVRLGLALGVFAVGVFSAKTVVKFKDNFHNLYMSHRIQDVITYPVQAQVLKEKGKAVGEEGETLKRVLDTNVIRVGFNTESIPYCYYNDRGELVGYDIAYAYQLARDLDCKVEFVPMQFDEVISELNAGYYDIGMSSLIMSEDRILHLDFTTPYRQDNNVLIVPVTKKNQFLNLKEIVERKGLKIGAGGVQVGITKRHFPNAEVIDLMNQNPLIKGEIDAILWSESTARIWCLSYPQFIAIDYDNQLGKSFFSYPIRQNSIDFRFFLDNWLTLKEQSGFKQKMVSYWIDGISPKKKKPRWSILRDVLHIPKQ